MTPDIVNVILVVLFISNLQSSIEAQLKDSMCGPLNVNDLLIANKIANITINEKGDIATVHCQTDYSLRGNSSIPCINGKWDQSEAPICYHNDCLNNSLYYNVTNTTLILIYSNLRDVYLKYVCNENDTKKNTIIVRCKDGHWHGNSDQCNSIENMNTSNENKNNSTMNIVDEDNDENVDFDPTVKP
ncbi:coagulation factor XIII B chain-like [Leptopilina boulardi]|uniref:coagulation factor XIII B chain-like n=1 Tax=Leptopilina boulardi TaxID=63433 RepID=UPI0021F677FC|nr:coagulation factor XIII B chain-like [Leptopilina boulardi]